MKSLHRFLPLLVLLLMLAASVTSCRDAGVRDALQHAEALMDTDPHAARAVLDSIEIVNRKIFEQREQRTCSFCRVVKRLNVVKLSNRKSDLALYALLRTQADYKCDIPICSDSLARIATDYYGTPRRPDYHAAMAWYTLGCAYGDMKDDVNATDALLKAKSLFPDTLVRYYALTEQNLGIHHLNRHMTHEAAQDFRSAKQNLIRLGDSTTVAFLDLSLARCCLYREEYASAKEWLERVLLNPHASQYVFIVAHFEMAKVEIYYTHDFTKAHEYLDYDIRHSVNKKELAGTYSLKAVNYQKQNQLDSAWYYFHRSLSCQSDHSSFANNYRQMAILAPQLGKADSIGDYVRLYHTYIDSLYIISNQQAIRQVMNDHRVEMERQRLEQRHRRRMLDGVIVFTILCFVLVTSYLVQRNRNRQKTIELQHAIRKNNAMLINPSAPSDESQETPVINGDVLANPDFYITLFRLGRQTLNPKVLKRLRRLDAIVVGGEADTIRREYEQAIDQAFVELITRLQLAGPSLNKQDMVYIISRMLGMEDKHIEVIQNTYGSTFRMRRKRLYDKLPRDLVEKLFAFSENAIS